MDQFFQDTVMCTKSGTHCMDGSVLPHAHWCVYACMHCHVNLGLALGTIGSNARLLSAKQALTFFVFFLQRLDHNLSHCGVVTDKGLNVLQHGIDSWMVLLCRFVAAVYAYTMLQKATQ